MCKKGLKNCVYLFHIGKIDPFLPYSPVIPLLNKKPSSIWLRLRHTVQWVGAQSSASLVWAKTAPWRIRNGNDRRKSVRIWPFLWHFTGERDDTRREDEGPDKKDRGGPLRWGKESSTAATELINPGSGGSEGWLNIPWTASHLRFKTIFSSVNNVKRSVGEDNQNT